MKRKRYFEEKIISISGYCLVSEHDQLERKLPEAIVYDNGRLAIVF